MANIGPVTNNLITNKTQLNTIQNSQEAQNKAIFPRELFGQLLQQALLQAELTKSTSDSSSSIFGSINPVNFTALGISSSLIENISSMLDPISAEKLSGLLTQKNGSSGSFGFGGLQFQETDSSLLNSKLDGVLQGKAEVFIEAGRKYGMSPVFLAAVSMHETGNGASNAARFKNNVAGMMGKNGLKSYDTVEESILDMARNLRQNYLDEGKLTIAQIGAKYAPVGAANDPTGLNNHWVNGVQGYMDRIVKTDFV
jgi:ethanolamine utilization protein EutQ (cupin superfamily)